MVGLQPIHPHLKMHPVAGQGPQKVLLLRQEGKIGQDDDMGIGTVEDPPEAGGEGRREERLAAGEEEEAAAQFIGLVNNPGASRRT